VTYVSAFDQPHGRPLSEIAGLIGGKAANLGVMTRELGLPVPPGFAISTEACHRYLADGWPDGLDDEIKEHLSRLEESIGRKFGDPANPLFLCVRSGAPVSMPGMMDTILNLGLNDATAVALEANAGPECAAGSRKRLNDQYQGIVGVPTPRDPWKQLKGAIAAVFRSWNSSRARSYRLREHIPDDLCTAVIVQTMVFGNCGADSAAGVLFTRNPASGEAMLYGDVIFNAQGDDVAAGTHKTEPISVLGERMPDVSAELRGYAERLERHYADVCEIEFTIEKGKLWLLQTRIGKRSPQAALRIAVEMAEDPDFPLDRREAVLRVADQLVDPPLAPAERSEDAVAIASGLGASPGVAVGHIVTTPEDAVIMAEDDRAVILVRNETSPDDVHGIAKAAGILTTSGGLASHAAVVARSWGIPAVVGAGDVVVDGDTVAIGGHIYAKGDTLTIDGATGEVFAGAVASEAEIVPQAAELLDWAVDLGIEIGAEAGDEREPGVSREEASTIQLDRNAVIHAMLIKGFVTPDDLAPILFTTPDSVSAHLDDLVADGLAEIIGGSGPAGMVQLTDQGKAAGREAVARDRAAWGQEMAAKALDDLLQFDLRMKETMTDWQIRTVDGQQVLNDHSDAEHDAAVLARFHALHGDSVAWLGQLAAGLNRLSSYVKRFNRAAEEVANGDTDYLASPRVDSFHSVWFELHEDLILLAGRTREEEVAAGRA